MTTFIGLYRGKTINDARLIAVSADADLCAQIAASILSQEQGDEASTDAIAGAVLKGRREALKRIAGNREPGGDDDHSR